MPYTQCTAVWSGTAGLPGYTKIKFLGALTTSECQTATQKLQTFFAAQTAYIPALVRVDVSTLCEHFDDDGTKTDVIQASGTTTQVVGTAAGAFNQAAGAWINFLCNQYVAGRRVYGRTFMVPLGSSAFQSDGTLLTTYQTALQNAGTTLITGFPNVIVRYDRTNKAGQRFQGISTVAAVLVKDKGGVLRSRRD
jgi:hypothetical protein